MNNKTTIMLLALVMAMPVLAQHQHSGMLVSSERNQVLQGSTSTSNYDGRAKDRGNRIDYSDHSTTTTSDNYDTFQVYTIESGNKVYVASERLLFPWSKPANITVGETVKFTIHKNKLQILDDDGKQHKATINSARMKE